MLDDDTPEDLHFVQLRYWGAIYIYIIYTYMCVCGIFARSPLDIPNLAASIMTRICEIWKSTTCHGNSLARLRPQKNTIQMFGGKQRHVLQVLLVKKHVLECYLLRVESRWLPVYQHHFWWFNHHEIGWLKNMFLLVELPMRSSRSFPGGSFVGVRSPRQPRAGCSAAMGTDAWQKDWENLVLLGICT